MIIVQFFGLLLFAASTIYLILALSQILRFRLGRPIPNETPGVTMLLPCHGTPPRFAECLRTLCRQDYAGPIQIVFGLHTSDDPARPVIENLIASLPGLDATLVIDSTRHGTHPKNSNLANMMAAVRHDVIVIADSDILVAPNLVETLVATLERDRVGASTCLYVAASQDNFASRLGATYVNDWHIPSGLVDLAVHGLGTTYGVATAIRRRLLDDIGGFAAMGSVVSSDFALGDEVRRRGFEIGLAPTVVSTVVAEPDLATLYRHEMRWMRSIRATRPLDHALWISSSALVPLVLLSTAWPLPVAIAAIGAHLGLRMTIHLLLRRRIGIAPVGLGMLIASEIANFLLWGGSFLGRRVYWGHHVMTAETVRN